MKALASIAVSILFLVIAGCTNTGSSVAGKLNREARAAGSPIRWKTESHGGNTVLTRVLLDLPQGESKAETPLKKDILSKIEQIELSKGRGAPELEDVRLMPSGREVWILKNPSHGVAYLIDMEPSKQGGTDFTITGPEPYSRR